MKATISFLIIMVAVLGFVAYNQSERMESQKVSIDNLSNQIKSADDVATLATQVKCANQAKVTFDLLGYGKKGSATMPDLFQSHFNPKEHRCFVLIESSANVSNGLSNTKILMDAAEQRVYGSYMWFPSAGKKYWEVAPVICKFTPTQATQSDCKSNEEFDAYVAKYME